MPIPLLMDVDTGIDDALALMLAVRSPEVDLVGVGTVAGNVDSRLAANNTLRVLEVVGAADVPVAVGAATPIIEPFRDAAWVHGDDGLGNSSQPAPSGSPSEESAVEQMIRLSHEHAGELTLVPVGPLTNLALALRADPELPSRLARVVLMGGSAREGGNAAPWAEANIGHDPEAAAVVFDTVLARTMVGLDVTTRVELGPAEMALLEAADDPAATLAAQILPHYLSVYEGWTGERACSLHDPLAVAVAAIPDLVTTSSLEVRVETAGRFTRGMTVVDLRGLLPGAPRGDQPRTDVALEVDGDRFVDLLMARLTNEVA